MTTQVTAPEMEVLAEAMRIVSGKTIMLPSRKHLKALAELNKELLEALKTLVADCEKLDISMANVFDAEKAISKAEKL